MRESAARSFQAYIRLLETVTYFKYLGRILKAPNDDFLAVLGNLQKDWKSWACMSIIMGREGASTRVSGILFNAVVQAVLLIGDKIWVIIPHIGRSLGGFQQRVVHQIMGGKPWQLLGGIWD